MKFEAFLTANISNAIIQNYVLKNYNEIKRKLEKMGFSFCNNSENKQLLLFLKNWQEYHARYAREIIDRAPFARSITKVGDYHNFQRAAVEIKDNNGQSLFYKPKSAKPLLFLNELYKLCRDNFNFKTLEFKKIWKNAYLCFELNTNTNFDVNKFSFHYGAICLLAQIFKITDLHKDNIIVSENSIPMIVDAETIFYPNIEDLPIFTFSGTLLLSSAFNNKALTMGYKNLNYTLMKEGAKIFSIFLKVHRRKIIDLLRVFCNTVNTRIIFKPTNFYLQVISNSIYPKFIKNPSKRTAYIAACLAGKHYITAAIRNYEQCAIEKLDVPIFYSSANNIYDGTGKKLPIKAQSLDVENCLNSLSHSLQAVLHAITLIEQKK